VPELAALKAASASGRRRDVVKLSHMAMAAASRRENYSSSRKMMRNPHGVPGGGRHGHGVG